VTLTSTSYDQHILDEARKLGDLTTISDIREYFTACQGADDISARNPLPAFFGRGTVTIRDLVAIIDRQRAEIASLREVIDQQSDDLTHVPMACTECGKPVREEGAPGGWFHKDFHDAMDCPLPDSEPIKARIDA
jgi:hypothetical protein